MTYEQLLTVCSSYRLLQGAVQKIQIVHKKLFTTGK